MRANDIPPVNLVVDCDEVLFEISTKWIKKLIELNDPELEEWLNLTIARKILNNSGEKALRDYVLIRKEFYLNKAFCKDITKMTPANTDKFFSVYDTEDFYDDIEPTKIAITLGSSIYNIMINHIYIVTRSSDINYPSKERALTGLFNNTKSTILRLNMNEKKSDIINKNNIDLTKAIIYEDELSNIEDYIRNCNVNETTFYIPEYGYNKPSDELIKLAENNKCSLIGYDAE